MLWHLFNKKQSDWISQSLLFIYTVQLSNNLILNENQPLCWDVDTNFENRCCAWAQSQFAFSFSCSWKNSPFKDLIRTRIFKLKKKWPTFAVAPFQFLGRKLKRPVRVLIRLLISELIKREWERTRLVKKEFVFPPPHSWLGQIWSVKHEQICQSTTALRCWHELWRVVLDFLPSLFY